MKLLFYIFIMSTCFCGVGCVSEVALKQNNSKITGANLPFEKESIHEIRLTYWVKVRKPGTYKGVVDSGIRKRILTITDSWIIQNNIEVFNILEMMLDSNKSPLIGEVVVVEKNGETWKMDFLKSNLLRISSGHLLKLDKSAFFIRLLANGMSAEKEFRDPELPLYNPLEWVALKREHAQKLPGLNYNPICDGLSEDFVFNLYQGDPADLENKKRSDGKSEGRSSCSTRKPPKTNGCGAESGLLNTGIDPVPDSYFNSVFFTQACNSHDECYGGFCHPIPERKELCDTGLKFGMENLCKQALREGKISHIDFDFCMKQANIYYHAVLNLAEGAFEEAQDEACIWNECCPC